MPGKIDKIPWVTLPGTNGTVALHRFRNRSNLVILCVGGWNPAWVEWLWSLSSRAVDLVYYHAEVLVMAEMSLDTLILQKSHLPPMFHYLSDPQGETYQKLGFAGLPLLVVSDRWGEVFLSEDEKLPLIGQVLEELKYLSIQCSSCSLPAEGWESVR
ncbi:MAG: hypothetical protein EXR62_16230 [Chloroflexi bacterium]|nr:hypothetical protein [Chloroflexota bacterium]